MIKSKKAFTLLDLLVALLVLSILAAISVAGYQGYRDQTAMLIDETNQKVLQAAVKLYAYDNNSLPGSLSDLRPEDLRRAYALVVGGRGSYTMLAYLKEVLGGEVAEAAPLPARYYQNNPSIVRCPSDSNGGVSYQINSFFANQPLSRLLLPANQNVELIFESDTGGDAGADPTLPNVVAYRHRRGQAAVCTTAAGDRKPLTKPTVN